MPLFQYKCLVCLNKTEKIHKYDEQPVVICQDCGDTMEKQISAPAGFVLKGAGFYKNGA